MNCPFINAVESDNEVVLTRLLEDVDPGTEAQLRSWAHTVLEEGMLFGMTFKTSEQKGRGMGVGKYVKKPVKVEAIEFTGDNGEDVSNFGGAQVSVDAHGDVYVRTLEGVMHVSVGDFVIRGVAGEFYPCKPDVFMKTYQPLVEA